MKSKAFIIKDILGTSNALIQQQGIRVYETVAPFMLEDYMVSLDFKDIHNVTSGFCNAAIGQLYTNFPLIAEKIVVIENVKPDSIISRKIKSSIDLALNPEKAKIIDDAIVSLFE